ASVRWAGRLDDRRPALDLALDQAREWLLTALGLARQHAAEFQQPFARLLVVERLVERVRELVENRLRRAFGREQGVPGLRLKCWQPCFLAGRHVGQRRIALRRADG